MTLYQQLVDWAHNQWIIVFGLAFVGVIIYLSGFLTHTQELYEKLTSSERLFKKRTIEFTRVFANKQNTHWKSYESKSYDLTIDDYPSKEYLDKSSVLFVQDGRYEQDPNPIVDVILHNNSNSSHILLSIGIEVISARYRIISGGSINKIMLEETEHYKIFFPIPKYITGVDMDNNKYQKLKINPTEYGGKGALILGAADPSDYSDAVFLKEWSWASTPITSMTAIQDPPHLTPGEIYRFTLEIEKSDRMPTDTLLSILVTTNNRKYTSDKIYFLKA